MKQASKKSEELDLIFSVLNQSFYEHTYPYVVYGITTFDCADTKQKAVLGLTPHNSPPGEICLRINKNSLQSLVTLEQGRENIDGSMFKLQPIENLLPVYRSALACSEATQPGFTSKLLGLKQPQHSRFSDLSDDPPTPQTPVWNGMDTMELNSSQQKALTAVISELTKENSLSIIQGPPGTGKTHFTANLLKLIAMNSNLIGPAVKMGEKSKESETTLATGPSNKSVVVMLEKFIQLGGLNCSRVSLFGVEDKLENSITERSVIEGADRHGLLSLSQFYEVVTNPRCVTDLLSRQIPAIFTFTLSNFHKTFLELCKRYRANTQHSIFREFFPLFREYTFVDLILEYIFPKNRAVSVGSLKLKLHDQVKISIEALNANFQCGGLSVNFKTEGTSVFEALDGIGNLLGIFIERITNLQEEMTLSLLSSADIIFATLNSTGNASLRRACKSVNIVLCDEAAQASEASTIIPISLCPRHLILVGDPAQLPAYVESTHAARMNCEISLMRRLVGRCGATAILLETQYRMHPEIIAYPNQQFYANKLNTSESVLQRPSIQSTVKCLFPHRFPNWLFLPFCFVSLEVGSDSGGHGSSFSNLAEANFILKILEMLRELYSFANPKFDLSKKITVITFYAAQVELLKRLLRNRNDSLSQVRVVTVDSIQGSESEIVILSFVRNNEQGNTGFVKNPNRLNVSLTRAMNQLICIGSTSTIKAQSGGYEGDSKALSDLVAHAESRSLVFSVVP